MGLISVKHLGQHGITGLWKITETEDELRAMRENDIPNGQEGGRVSDPLKRRQRLAVRLLLKELRPEVSLSYDGKVPVLSDGAFVSVSHSSEMAAVIVNEKLETGIDIQRIYPRIIKIRQRFMSDEELDEAGEADNIIKLHVYWCSKEALYKSARKPGLIFREQIRVHPFPLQREGNISAFVTADNKVQTHRLFYQNLGEYILAHLLP